MADGSRAPDIRITPKSRTRAALVGDLFCGAGGLSNGAARAMRELGRPVQLIAVNHWPVAIETNRRNHADHADRIHCADLESALPLTLVPEGRLDLLIAAPSCVFHSRARGGRPVHDQQRMDPWHVVRWCTELRVGRILVENVPEFMEWGPCSLVTGRPIKSRRGEYFRAWIAALEAVGFKVDWKVLTCADYGDPTTRRRFFLIGRSDGKRLRWPEPSHDRVGGTDLLGSRQRWRGAREVIDWTMTGNSIFSRKKPLKPNTLRRILAGAQKYRWPQPYNDAVQALLDGTAPRLAFNRADAIAQGLIEVDPMLVHLRGTSEQHLQATSKSADEPLPTLTAGGSHVGLVLATSSGGAARDLDQPLPTITTGGAGAERPGCARPQLVEPIIVPTSNTSSAGVPRSAAEPIRTVTTAKGGDQALAVPLVAQYYGATTTAQSVAEPVPCVTTKARFGLAEPVVMRGDVGTGRTGDMRPASEPMPTITCSESLALAEPFLVPNFGEAPGQTPRTHSIDDPMPTVTATGHVQLAAPSAEVADEVRIDINYRMLHWRELARATSFDDEGEVYDFAGNATEITKQIGNAVPNRTAKALVKALMQEAA